MNNEIKEILDKLREQYNTDSKLGKEIANEFGKYQLNYKELTLLLDYITNLEKENENRISESLSYDLAVARIKKLEQENENKDKLEQQRKEYQETYQDVRIELKEKDETITNLQEELENKNKEIKDLKNRLYAITTKFN